MSWIENTECSLDSRGKSRRRTSSVGVGHKEDARLARDRQFRRRRVPIWALYLENEIATRLWLVDIMLTGIRHLHVQLVMVVLIRTWIRTQRIT